MVLTGKAKDDFEKWLENYTAGFIEYTNTSIKFLTLNSKIQNSIIIEWLDSVGIYVNVSPNYLDHDIKYSKGDFKAVLNFKNGTATKSIDYPLDSNFNNYSRQEATKQAILKANQIYNER